MLHVLSCKMYSALKIDRKLTAETTSGFFCCYLYIGGRTCTARNSIGTSLQSIFTVADPGFPVGGAPTRWGGANLRRIHFSAKMYVKTKEIDPVGGARAAAPPLDPPMIHNGVFHTIYRIVLLEKNL